MEARAHVRSKKEMLMLGGRKRKGNGPITEAPLYVWVQKMKEQEERNKKTNPKPHDSSDAEIWLW